MSLFGWSLVRTSELSKHEDNLIIIQNLITAHRWFSGWKDLEIIWKYIFNHRPIDSVETARKNYAKERNTDEYGVPKYDIHRH